MQRFKVKIKNAKDCRTELTFLDLCIKYSNGFSPTLKVKEGEEIPLDVCDPEDVRKSLKVGSLRDYLKSDWIEEVKEEIEQEIPIVQNNTNFVTEQDIKISSTNIEVSLPQPSFPEVQVIDQPVSLAQNGPITDLTKVFSYEDFNRLSHFLKLRFIKEAENIDLLRDILGKTPSNQFKNNIQFRLSQLKI